MKTAKKIILVGILIMLLGSAGCMALMAAEPNKGQIIAKFGFFTFLIGFFVAVTGRFLE
jgi:hypothetical protein